MQENHYQEHAQAGTGLRIAMHSNTASETIAGIPGYAQHLVAALTELDAGIHIRTREERARTRLRLLMPFRVRNRRVDVVHALDCGLPRTRQPRIVTVHDLAFVTHPECVAPQQTNHQLRMLPVAVRTADGVITLSTYTRRMLLRYMPDLDPLRVVAIPPGVSPSATSLDVAALAEVRGRYGLTEPFILAVGTLEPRQNYLRLIQAFAAARALTGGPHRLVIAGQRGWQCAPILDEIVRMGIADSITLIAEASAATVDALFALATVVADVAITTGVSPSVLAAMRQGTPLVVSDGGALPEMAGGTALIVPFDDVAALANALHRVCQDEGLRHHLRVRGLARVGQFTWRTTAHATRQLYEMVLGRIPASDRLAA